MPTEGGCIALLFPAEGNESYTSYMIHVCPTLVGHTACQRRTHTYFARASIASYIRPCRLILETARVF